MTEVVEKKKRGRKKKEVTDNIVLSVDVNENQEPVVKKRGRKPKGGKIIVKNEDTELSQPNISNIILHLKCSSSDINENDSTKFTRTSKLKKAMLAQTSGLEPSPLS